MTPGYGDYKIKHYVKDDEENEYEIDGEKCQEDELDNNDENDDDDDGEYEFDFYL